MKLGLVLECDTGGPDELVLTCLARRLNPEITIQPVALGNKAQLFQQGVETAQELVETSDCDLVLIVWDLKPYWQEAEADDCESEAAILRTRTESLPTATAGRIRLLCITWELETWLIADHRAVNAHLSTDAHPSKFKCKHPMSVRSPKALLNTECVNHRGRSRPYVDYREAIKIARLIPDTSRLRRVDSFVRFSGFVTEEADDKFQRSGEICEDLIHQAHQFGKA